MRKIFLFLLFLIIFQTTEASGIKTIQTQPGPDLGQDASYGTVYHQFDTGNQDLLRTGGWGDSYFSFIKFSEIELDEGAGIEKVTLNLFHFTTTGTENFARVSTIQEPWNELSLSFVDNPSYGTPLSGWYLVKPELGWIQFDVTEIYTGWVNNEYPNYGFRIEGQFNSNNHVRHFRSSDYLDDPTLRPYLEITYTLPEENDDVDPLVLEYAPKLLLHPDEGYQPMDVEDFIDASALWSRAGADAQLESTEAFTSERFIELLEDSAGEDWYMAFSDPDSSKSIDVDAGREAYELLESPMTVYYHKMEDGDYVVLQYWYFYAMNDWKEKGGLNNHEGDWESVFVYLNKDTLEPEYVAYSAHHNDGNPSFNALQYGSVRRSWDSEEVEREGSSVRSYVALGSHANYPNHNDGLHNAGLKNDLTSTNGETIESADVLTGNEIGTDAPFWMSYEGLWGADTVGAIGGDAPQGPVFSNVSGLVRFSSPVEWAGIDKIGKQRTKPETRRYEFQGAGVLMSFKQQPEVDKELLVDPYEEWVRKGQVSEGVKLLPKYWDITSELENETFTANVSFDFDTEAVMQLGGEVYTLGVYYYNPETNAWERKVSQVNEDNETVSFTTNHFSRYALGFVEVDVYQGDLFALLREEIRASELRSYMKRYLVRKVDLIERLSLRDTRYTVRFTKRSLIRLERSFDRFERNGSLSKETAEELTTLSRKIRETL